MIETFKKAKKCYFVSNHNKQLTEEQFGFRFSNAEVVWNPVKITKNPIPYPDTKSGFRLACVGRLFIIDKGQDILLRILSKEPWSSRPVKISFVGTGHDEEGIKALTQLLNITNVEYLGHQKNIEDIWKKHHALVLPSRSEGMALSVLEAMAAARTVITTIAGGHADIIEHGKTGFIADATEKILLKQWKTPGTPAISGNKLA
ncbi:glycosyltransferase [Niabella ginsengisoli]|uniref:Glycosyltransferase n=1 Tax=Niabella ginsengisoli TaxID=522298 RepID=A0ABS9SH41_9BACT|nr:glycosyltransferase [Niabella ginsengisoli]MCH5597636.1 glycosyltransferase [Niabella ginsengisoli]